MAFQLHAKQYAIHVYTDSEAEQHEICYKWLTCLEVSVDVVKHIIILQGKEQSPIHDSRSKPGSPQM